MENEKNYVKETICGILVGVIIVFLLLSVTIINSGYRGLKFKFGALQDDVLEEGLHFKIPFVNGIKKLTIKPIELNHTIEVGEDGSITRDNQTIGAELVVFFKYSSDKLTDLYRNYGTDKIASLVKSILRESFKETIGEYDIFNLAVKQDEIRNKVVEKIRVKFVNYPIEFVDLKINNYDWSDDFDSQIAETMKRAQQVKQAEQDLLLTEQQAQKWVKKAEAQKQAAITQAEGKKESARLMAEAKALEGEGIRKYNESIRATKDIEISLRGLEIDKIKAEKWNGQYVPEQNFTPIPFTNAGLLGK